MAPNTIYQTVMRTTQRLFGVAIDRHSFRSIGATRLALGTVDDGRHARPWVGQSAGTGSCSGIAIQE